MNISKLIDLKIQQKAILKSNLTLDIFNSFHNDFQEENIADIKLLEKFNSHNFLNHNSLTDLIMQNNSISINELYNGENENYRQRWVLIYKKNNNIILNYILALVIVHNKYSSEAMIIKNLKNNPLGYWLFSHSNRISSNFYINKDLTRLRNHYINQTKITIVEKLLNKF